MLGEVPVAHSVLKGFPVRLMLVRQIQKDRKVDLRGRELAAEWKIAARYQRLLFTRVGFRGVSWLKNSWLSRATETLVFSCHGVQNDDGVDRVRCQTYRWSAASFIASGEPQRSAKVRYTSHRFRLNDLRSPTQERETEPDP